MVLTIGLLYGLGASAEGVWKWVDKNGVPHYSDQPVPGAVRIDLNVQTYQSSEAAIAPTSRSAPQQTPAKAPVAYNVIEIWKPADDQAIIATGGQVSVSVRVEPDVQAGHSLRLELDGVRVSEPDSRTTAFDLKEIPRGTHTLSASIVNRTGETLAVSTPVKFHVIQPTVR